MKVSLGAVFGGQKSGGSDLGRRRLDDRPSSNPSCSAKKRRLSRGGGTDVCPSTDHNLSSTDGVEPYQLSTRRSSDSLTTGGTSDPSFSEPKRPEEHSNEVGLSVMSKDVVLLKEIIVDSQKQLMSTVKSLAVSSNEVTESLFKKVNDLERIVMKSSENMMSLMYLLSKRDKKKKASEKDKKMDMELLLLDVLFCDDVVERVMETCTLRSIEAFLDKGNSHQISAQASSAFRTIMFSKPVGSPISLFSRGIGQEHSIYRKSVVVTLIDSVRRNIFNQVDVEDNKEEQCAERMGCSKIDGRNEDDSSELKPRCPRWLKNGYISENHIEQVKNSKEVTQSETSGGRKSKHVQLSRNEIACEAVERIFKLVINRIKVGRENGKNAFFQEVGYLFVVWSQILSANTAREVNQESVDLQWYREKKSDDDIDIDDTWRTKHIPRTDLTYACADENPTDYNVNNVKLFAEFIEDNPDMILQVSHDVVVKIKKKGKSLTEKRKLVRYINLLDVAARVISNFVGVRNPSSPMSILSAVPTSIKCLYALARLFHGLIDCIMTGIGEHGCKVLYRSEENENDYLGDYKPVYYESLTIGDLVPSKTKQLKTMAKCVNLTEGEFKSLNESTKSVDHSCEFEEDEEEENEGNEEEEDYE